MALVGWPVARHHNTKSDFAGLPVGSAGRGSHRRGGLGGAEHGVVAQQPAGRRGQHLPQVTGALGRMVVYLTNID